MIVIKREKIEKKRMGWQKRMFEEKDHKPIFVRLLSCLKPWECQGGSPPFGHTINYNTGDFCVYGGILERG